MLLPASVDDNMVTSHSAEHPCGASALRGLPRRALRLPQRRPRRRTAPKPLPVEQDEPSDPIDVSLLGTDAVMQPPDDASDVIELSGFTPPRGRILMSVHAVFPYGGARARLHNPLPRQDLRTLPKPRPRHNTAPQPLWSRRLFRRKIGTKPLLGV
jgi:hypothetical protein